MYAWENPARRLCATCNRDRLVAAHKQKGVKPLKRTTIAKKPSRGLMVSWKRDREVNDLIWESRPHVCIECAANLPEYPDRIFFSHLHSKGSHPASRHDPDNIVLHCPDCHQKWEFEGGRELKMPKTLALFQAYNPV